MKNKKNKTSRKDQAPTLVLRLFALIGDFALGHAFFYLLLSFSGFSYWERSLKIISIIFSEEGWAFLILWYTVTMLLRFTHTLLTGLSPFQFLLGFRFKGPWPRLMGGLRVGLEFVTLPLLIFSLPLLKGRPTFAEKFSQTQLLRPARQSVVLNCIRFGLLLPTVFFMAVAAPLMRDLSLLDGLVVSVGKVKKEKLKKGANFSNFKTFGSEKYKFKTFSSLAEGRFTLLPDFELIKLRGKKRISPYLLIMDSKRKTTGELKLRKRLSLLDILKVAKRGNPFFGSTYPRLNKAIEMRKTSFNIRDMKGKAEKLFDPLLNGEIEDLIRSCFELRPGKLLSETFKRGPFFRGHVELRRTLISLLRAGIRPEVDMVRVGNANFLRFRQRLKEDIPLNKQVIETYIPIDTQNSMILELGWDKSLEAALSANAFRYHFLASSEWFFDYKNFFKLPEEESKMTVLSAIDFLGVSQITHRQKELLEGFLYRYYYEEVRKSFKKSSQERLEVLTQNMSRLSSVIDIKENLNGKSFSELFIGQWYELLSALKDQNKSYFNL